MMQGDETKIRRADLRAGRVSGDSKPLVMIHGSDSILQRNAGVSAGPVTPATPRAEHLRGATWPKAAPHRVEGANGSGEGPTPETPGSPSHTSGQGSTGSFPRDGRAVPLRDEHADLLAVAAIPVAELCDEVALLEVDADQDVAGGGDREEQV